MQSFEIKQKLPSYNEVTMKNRTNPHSGNTYKQDIENAIIMAIWASDVKKITNYPIALEITYYEPNMKRDVDNIIFSTKFILDAMQKAGVLANDSPKCLPQPPLYKIVRDGVKEHRVFVKIIG